jgi:glycosyltransferase involved in cell wall biosynthesis
VSPEFARQAEQISDNPHGRYIMGAATLNRRKNLEGLIRSFLGIEDRDVKLIVVGASDARIYGRDLELGELLRDERIVLTGYVTDAELASLYRNALTFVYPSLYEGFGIPPLEAMSLGCPVITSNTASLPEVCGDAAHYVDPRDVPGITDAIDLLLRDEAYRRELSAKGIERAKLYDWKRSAERFLEIARGA